MPQQICSLKLPFSQTEESKIHCEQYGRFSTTNVAGKQNRTRRKIYLLVQITAYIFKMN